MKEQYVLKEIEFTTVHHLNRLLENFYEVNKETIDRLIELKLITPSTNSKYLYELTGSGHLACNIGYFNWYTQLGYLEDELNKLNKSTANVTKKKSWWDRVLGVF